MVCGGENGAIDLTNAQPLISVSSKGQRDSSAARKFGRKVTEAYIMAMDSFRKTLKILNA